ncbi:phospholipid-transporting ATPase ABCA1-like isoform X1 [Tachypleus tridentatus]|uniref:phospholipid-transporting ATPase ABCA1-like isoform X1 n=2 Tax=Tachypleus tridentatus TaxID=6853 RepID=UPI003FD45DF9
MVLQRSMGLRNQIYLLLWKNFTLHKRQKVRVVVELVWPLFLFLILTWVRTRGLKLYIHECHFDEKALPSAGILPFLKSTICTFNNTCYSQVVNGQSPSEVPTFNTSIVMRAVSDVGNIFKKQIESKNFEMFDKLSTNLKSLTLFVKRLTDPDSSLKGEINMSHILRDVGEVSESVLNQSYGLTKDTVESLLKSRIKIGGIPQLFARGRLSVPAFVCKGDRLRKLLSPPEEGDFKLFINDLCKLTSDEWKHVILELGKNLDILELLRQISGILEQNMGNAMNLEQWEAVAYSVKEVVTEAANLESLWELQNNIQISLEHVQDFLSFESYNTTARLIQVLICGRNTTEFFDPNNQGPARRFEEFKDQLEREREKQENKNDTQEYKYDNATTPKCNSLFKTLEENEITRFIWNQMKPFIRGKILFTPNNPATRRIISRVNSTFAPLVTLQSWSSRWLDVLSVQVELLMQNSTETIQTLKKVTSPGVFSLSNLIQVIFKNSSISGLLNNLGDQTITGRFAEQFHDYLVLVSENWESWLNQINFIMQEVKDYSQCIELNRFEGYDSEDEVIFKGLDLLADNKLWASLVFTNMYDLKDDNLPPYIKYKIRMDSKKVDSTKKIEDMISRPGPRRRPAIDLKYFTYGFAFLQDMVEHAIIHEHTGRLEDTGIYMQQFPYPCYIFDQFIMAISRSFPMFMVLSWVYTSAMIIKSIVHEKEQRLKEVMKVMGLSNGVLWLAWFINSFCFMTLSCALLTLILVFGKVLLHSDAIIIFLFLMCYAVATIMQSFLLSTFFSKANIAAAAGGIVFFILYLPYNFVVLWEEELTVHVKTAVSLLSNVAFGLGCNYFAHFEEEGVGVQWWNFSTSTLPIDSYSLAHCMGMLLLDGVIYGILTWYIEAVFPGKYGVPKPWYFFMTSSYWCGTVKIKPVTSEDSESGSHHSQVSSDFEEEPKDLLLGVSILHLSKVYKNGLKPAVDNLSLNFYEGQITSFLGHNGAGKTTTISILTGMFPPTLGTAKIYGCDIRTDMDIIRKNLGTCPQYNVLFDQLSVLEHLWFYVRLKGASEKDAQLESQSMVEDLGLGQKMDESSKNLSGGMQRKLSIAVAFVGGSRTVILDEPTAGVDPYARRSIWEMLLKYKTGRTIILTTHHMDEADLLGDRIAVISQGKLRCSGSSLFLKTRFGSGYYLTLVKALSYRTNGAEGKKKRQSLQRSRETDGANGQHEVDDEGVADMSATDSKSDHSENSSAVESPSQVVVFPWERPCSVSKVTAFIRAYIAEARLIEDVGSELSYLLPPGAQNTNTLGHLFEALDANLDALCISSYGISDTSLEEVFLKVTSVEGEQLNEDALTNAVESLTEGGKYATRVRTESLHGSSLWNAVKALRFKHVQGLIKPQHSDPNMLGNGSDESAASQRLTEGGNGENGLELPSPPIDDRKRLTGMALVFHQIKAIHKRRFHHTIRNRKGIFCEIILPSVFVCLALLLTLMIPPFMEEPPLELTPWLYGPPNYIFYSNKDPDNPLTQAYIEQLLGNPGLGTRCVAGDPLRELPCKPTFINSSLLLPQYNLSQANRIVPCNCNFGTQHCPANVEGPEPPSVVSSTTDIIYNMTGRNISDWLVKTTKKYYKKRYGGFTFGEKNLLGSFNFTSVKEVAHQLIEASGFSKKWKEVETMIDKIEKQLHNVQVFDNIKVWFNNKGWASSVAYMNALNNLILRTHLPAHLDPHQYGISVVNQPMNFTQDQLQEELLKKGGLSLLHAVCVIFAMSFVPASFVMFLIEDRVCGSKHLQFVNGVKPLVYWTATYIWDLANYIIPAILCIFIFLAFREDAYVSENNFGGLVLLLILYGWASVPLMYPASYVFTVPSSAFVALACLNLFIGIVTTVATFVLELFDDEELRAIAAILKKVFLIFPHYCLGRGLMDMSTNHLAAETFARFGINTFRDPMEWDFLGRNLLSMSVQAVGFFFLTILIQYRFFISKREPSIDEEIEDVDDDVAAERKKVLNGSSKDAVLKIENLTKVYRTGQHPAVNHLCVIVKPGDCFGLLGVNGAGKTTTFKMLTGRTSVTSGNAFINGFSIKTEVDKARENIGYCPQFDALDSLLTGMEHLEFYARLRGIPEKYVRKIACWGTRKLGLTDYADRCAGTYSGGNKRKLSTAIALLGNPSVVFLDEPTTGMDPKARRFLWNCIIDMVKEGRSVVLTSHSMEECEALCTRLAIMVNGQFRCLGSIQHLKNKYGEGYMLSLRVGGGLNGIHQVACFMEKAFGNQAVLGEQHLNQMEYLLASSLPLSTVFHQLEKAKELCNIEDYSLAQTTLDQVFIRFAKLQTDVSEEELPKPVIPAVTHTEPPSEDKEKKCEATTPPGGSGVGDIELCILNNSLPHSESNMEAQVNV